ncbi:MULTISPECIES: AMP-binding protein [unclassified Mycolicibacterium]|uniref:AMP-binding protein n=1 Tax=unclassified Mycolicibacterium TaxID=2636767 RepID=UPI0012DDE2A5|nr:MULTISPECIES: AMP-binding protein [unclassified Mycolicibacterium]MUL83650.1 AMP-binding protein [Mycolicibacterium sp. CBMA 329]MUL90641.1 AMP-binding protein [Mycolicibacterium sp. CBMA 331]MUM00611.1 AMP-binding protein [Mycolicibacterium sp. CBMA 334]MUM28407.1 AMP-binding protein [Mycolicibacterium sp. CBMA 295]MUM41585.1 AMP-binding protein [Mycolicibacterium sp. CBMA 247]
MDAVSRTTTQTMHTQAVAPLHQGFFTHAQAAPDGIAVFGPTTRWTYGQLREQALAVSGALAVAGVRIGDRVAVVGPAGLDTVIATLGILAAGGVCVPIDTTDPAEPILERTGVRMALFTGDGPPNWLPALTVSEALRIGAHARDVTPVCSGPGDPAFVASVDEAVAARDVVVTHAAARDAVAELIGRLAVSGDDRIGAFSAAESAAPILMVLVALTAGAGIVVADDAPRPNPERRINSFARAAWRRDAVAALDTAVPS